MELSATPGGSAIQASSLGSAVTLIDWKPISIPGGTAMSWNGAINNAVLTCVYCLHAPTTAPPATGWTVSGTTFTNYNMSTLMAISSGRVQSYPMNSGFTNYESLTIANNLGDVGLTVGYLNSSFSAAGGGGQHFSCSTPPVLPTGSGIPFFSLGNGVTSLFNPNSPNSSTTTSTSSDPATVTNNYEPNGSPAPIQAWATGNGC
jgi:hypothetical protein